ncbi:terminase [Pseudomonas phage 119X]|uniref:terminase n=1 Tax=Pseudomonas phage 119X TaxID=2911431 RepID=UPI00015294B1|nr:terminase [Pseudomonas phage 119X]
MDKKERIARLLATGLKAAQVADLVAVSPSYISQLLTSDSDFRDYVTYLRTESAEETGQPTEAEALELKYEAAEHTAIKALLERLPIMEDKNLLTAVQVLSNRRQQEAKAKLLAKGIGYGGSATQVVVDGKSVKVTHLQIPAVCAPDFTYSDTKEIVAIGDRSTNPMPTPQLKGLLESYLGKADPSGVPNYDSFD